MTINFLDISNEDFEFLIEDILIKKGFTIKERPSRGPDLGRDITAERYVTDDMKNSFSERYLIECKHFAKSNKSVKESDVKNITERIKLHKANRYLLATSSTVSTVVNNQLNAISSDESNIYKCTYWGKSDITQFLEVYPELIKKYFENWELISKELVNKLQEHFFDVHRGAMLYSNDVTVVFGNDGYKSKKGKKIGTNKKVQLEIDQLRKEIKKRNEKEIAFALSDDDYSWALLVQSNKAHEYNEIIWKCIDMPGFLKSTQSIEAFRKLWTYHTKPFR